MNTIKQISERGDLSNKDKRKSIFEYFGAPLITGFVFIAIQFFTSPLIEKKKTIESDIWIQKKETIIKAAELVNDKFQSLRFNANDTSTIIFDNYKEVNSVYFRLLILCDNEKIAKRFWHFFDNSNNSFSPVDRGEFISLLKKELTGKEMETRVDSIPILKSPNKFK